MPDHTKLIIHLHSFGYKKSGIPNDPNGHGGGFVFDCRFIDNPGRQEQYKKLTGLDPKVQKYLFELDETQPFIDQCLTIINNAIKAYSKREFNSLMVSFGCTGGQHRSVYCAEKIAIALKNMSNTQIILNHTESSTWPK